MLEVILIGTGVIEHEYTFGGEKIKKIGEEGTRIYLGGFEYKDGNLEHINIPNGRILKTSGTDRYQYNLTDHLGNVVVMFEDISGDEVIQIEEETNGVNDEVLQRNHYYSFGMRVEMPLFNMGDDPKNKYLYNSKELQNDFGLDWLDYGARYYDAAIGRWGQVDPLAENHLSWSPYNYVLNNPILLIDPDGRDTSFADNNARQVFQVTYQNIVDKIAAIDASDMKQKKKNRRKKSLLKDKKVLDDIIDAEETFMFETVEREKAGFGLGENGDFKIGIPEGENTEDLLFHESVHGNQYLDGKIGFDENRKPIYYDYSDELDAYSQQFSYARRYLGKDLKKIAIGNAKVDPSSVTDKTIIQAIIKRKYAGNPYIIKSFTPVNKPK